jgi:hypothetical protein
MLFILQEMLAFWSRVCFRHFSSIIAFETLDISSVFSLQSCLTDQGFEILGQRTQRDRQIDPRRLYDWRDKTRTSGNLSIGADNFQLPFQVGASFVEQFPAIELGKGLLAAP